MCGIAGLTRNLVFDSNIACERMLDAMTYRGPDSRQTVSINSFSLGHLRLSILDLAPTGAQPMQSQNKRWWLTFNGEIYNFCDLKNQLDGLFDIAWRGTSDTEVLLEAIAHWGIEKTLAQINGMFAFAALEVSNQRLFLARDRFGEKPLYVYRNSTDQQIAFASELKAIEVIDGLHLDIDRNAVAAVTIGKYIPAPASIYRQVTKVEPGTCLVWRQGSESKIFRYFDPIATALSARCNPLADALDAVDTLEQTLAKSVSQRMVSDAPLGAFLSGGIDSSTVVALMQASSSVPVKTFSIGFEVEGYNEADHARAVAAHLGTDHTEQTVTATDALAVVPTLGAMFDEPFSDSSQIPTWLVSRMARESVTVSLSGDGGDELFCGYSRYAGTARAWKLLSSVPGRRWLARLFTQLPDSAIDFMFKPVAARISRYTQPGRLAPKLKRVAVWAQAASLLDFYRQSIGVSEFEPGLVLGASPVKFRGFDLPDSLHPIEQLMLEDVAGYLAGDILTKVDRTTMSVSLEGRMPLLDPLVYETAWRLPLEYKHHATGGKWALRQVLYRYVPQHLVDRPKMGFGAPMTDWLRGPLREWSSDLLSEQRLHRQALYNAPLVQRQYTALLEGRSDRVDDLWSILMVQAWLDADAKREKRLTPVS